jgi:Fanconi-associated nuclease 1
LLHCCCPCRFYGLDGSQVTVEGLALQHYASEEGGGWQGLHCEGGVWAMLFGLLLWDVLFMSESGGCCCHVY